MLRIVLDIVHITLDIATMTALLVWAKATKD